MRAMLDRCESKSDLLRCLVGTYGTPLDERAQLTPGEPHLLFPQPSSIAQANLVDIDFPRTLAGSVRALSAAMVADAKLLRAYEPVSEAVAKLRTLPGIGSQTAQHIAMHALREPDAFPVKETRELQKISEAWRPWRAYAAMRLQMQEGSMKFEDDDARH
jgi:AraC family transcriptional regulator of adaptative response / DNA-3-methyladenine glycosylase II